MASNEDSPLVSFGRRLGRHSAIYAAGAVGTFIFGMVNMAVLTRVLPIEEFGRLAVYLMFATLLSTLYNLGSLQGILISVFGSAGTDEEMAVDDEEGDLADVDRERALTTGVLLTVAIGTLGTATVFALAPLVADLLGAPGEVGAVRLAALCGGTGAVWRLVHNIARLERRPGLYSGLGLVRPMLALGLGVALVVAGHGIEGALGGVAIGTALAVPVAIAVERRNYAFGLELRIVPEVFRRGAFVVPLILAMWIITNVDLFLVSVYAPSDDVGPYRVASRIGAGVSYLVSAVTMAWLPLRRTPLHMAMKERHGPSGFGATILTAFLLVCIWVVLGLTLLADLLIRIAPESYSDAAPLVPLIGLGLVAAGAGLLIYRGTKLPGRRPKYIGMMLAGAVLFLVLGLVLVPIYGAYGAAISQIVAFGGVAAGMLWLAQRSKHPLPLDYGRLGRGVGLGLFCIGFGLFVSPLAGDLRILLDLLVLAAFPALLVVAGAFPSEELRAFVDLSRPTPPRRQSDEMVTKLELLDSADRRVVASLVANGGSAEPETMTRFVAALRVLGPERIVAEPSEDIAGEEEAVLVEEEAAEEAAAEEQSDRDPEIAAYLLSDGGIATRDFLGRQLCEEGVDPLDLDALDTTLSRLRRIPRHEWERLAR